MKTILLEKNSVIQNIAGVIEFIGKLMLVAAEKG